MQSNSHSSKFIGLCVIITVMLASLSTASAQQADESSDAELQQAGVSGDDDRLHWAQTRDIFTVQKRPFQKEGRFALSAYGGIIPNNIFEQYFPVGLRVNYYILENIGLELAGSYAFTAKTGLADTIQTLDENVPAPLIGDTQVSHSNFGVVWSPFYGKTSFYNSALAYFDMYVFGGAGIVITETQSNFNAEPSTSVKPEGVLGAGLAFYLGDHATIRLDFRQFIFEKVTGGVANPSEASLGLGWFF